MIALAKIPIEEDAAAKYLYLFVYFLFKLMTLVHERISTNEPGTDVGGSGTTQVCLEYPYAISDI